MFKKFIKYPLIIIITIILATLAVRATDKKLSQVDDSGRQCPEDMVFIISNEGGFCIDKYEASTGEECPFSNPGTISETRNNLNLKPCLPVSEAGRMPWRNISQNQAEIACAKAGKRLPTSKEWHLAALGTPDLAEKWTEDDCQVDSNWKHQPGLTGSAENCESAAGAYDMIGNVWEWIDAVLVEGGYGGNNLPEAGFIEAIDNNDLPSATNTKNPSTAFNGDYLWIKKFGTKSIARGGFWNNRSEAGQYAAYAVVEADSSIPGIGFRCVK